jgi:hypothetical protein
MQPNVRILFLTPSSLAFSVRALVSSLAVLSIFTAILLGYFLNQAEQQSQVAAVRRRAESLARLSATAKERGVNMVGPDLPSTLHNLLEGKGGDHSPIFRANGVTKEQATEAAKYLRLEGGELRYAE